jgi:hypothetical protein
VLLVLVNRIADNDSINGRPRRSRSTLQPPQSIAPHDHDDHERLCAPGTPRSSQVNPPSSHNSNVPQVEKRIPHAHHDERNLASHLVAYSDGQRPSSLDNYLAIHAEDSGKSITSIEAEEVLPDDSPLTYIGMAHLHRQHSSNQHCWGQGTKEVHVSLYMTYATRSLLKMQCLTCSQGKLTYRGNPKK